MDREEALKLLRGGPEGVKEWNSRVAAGMVVPNLQEAFLINCDLRGVDLRGAYLAESSFSHADLRAADLVGAQLIGADLRGADLRGTNLRHANVSGAVFGQTLIACDLSKTVGLDAAVHVCRSILDVHCLLHFRDKLPQAFLRGCGLPREEIAHFLRRGRQAIELPCCFLCYGAEDEAFAQRLHDDLQRIGVRCWKWNHDARVCEELVTEADSPLGPRDHVVLIASRQSLAGEAVNQELERVIAREDRRAGPGPARAADGDGPPVALPADLLHVIRLDGFIFEQDEAGQPLWKHRWREAVVDRRIIDATGWENAIERYEAARDTLLAALGGQLPPG